MKESPVYKMPAEWERHQRTLVSWPVKDSMNYPEKYDGICKGYEEIIRAIAEFEPVTIMINQEDAGLAEIMNNRNMTFLAVGHNDAWLRDNGPTFVYDKSGGLSGINWLFNAWGEKYEKWDDDNLAASKILKHYKIPCVDAPLVMEGGSFHTDGEGTLLTTEECLLNSNRNPLLSKREIEDNLKKFLGVKKIIWLKNGLSGDETDGHVDNIACFARPGEIIMQVCEDPEDENYHITKINREILERERDALGRSFQIIPIQPPPKRIFQGKRLTLSYLNFFIVNGGIILPVFGDDANRTDEMAAEALGRVFPNRKIRKIDGMKIVIEGGNVHCITQQMPEVDR